MTDSKRFFFVMGLPRSRTAWLSMLLTHPDRSYCYHEGTIGCARIEDYIDKLRNTPEPVVGDANAMLPYYVGRILVEFPDAPWIIVHRNEKEAKAALIAAEPDQREAIETWWPAYAEQWDLAVYLVRAHVAQCNSERNAQLVEKRFESLDYAACYDIAIAASRRILSLRDWTKLNELNIAVNENRFDGGVPMPDPSINDKPIAGGADYCARHYSPLDFETLNDWCVDHTGYPLHEDRLPPLGIVVENNDGPMCALFAQMAVSRGVAYLQDPLSRPGLAVAEARRAFAFAFGALKGALKANGYTLIIAHTPHAALSRELEANYGFRAVSKCNQLEVQI